MGTYFCDNHQSTVAPRAYKDKKLVTLKISTDKDVLFEFHLKFWNTASIGIPVRSLLLGRQTSTYLV